MTDKRLDEYGAKRAFSTSPEPSGGQAAAEKRFVVQRHDASHLHFDFRLEIGGVLKSWAVPKGPPMAPKEKRLAIAVEDHPLEYADFSGTIPAGQYGAGTVEIWDSGTFEPIKDDNPAARLKQGKFSFILNGRRLKGPYALVKTTMGPKSWLLIAEKPRQDSGPEPARKSDETPMPESIDPMLATAAPAPFTDEGWVFETKWDGFRAVAFLDSKKLRFASRNHSDLTSRFPELAGAAQEIEAKTAILDGEIVAIDATGRPDFNKLPRGRRAAGSETAADQASIVYYAFDLLYLDGLDLRNLPLVERRVRLDRIIRGRTGRVRPTDYIPTDGEKLFTLARERGFEGIMAKKKESAYIQRRSRDWLKIKVVRTLDAVICGFTEPQGSRGEFGALTLGAQEDGDLIYIGNVGTGFTESDLREIGSTLKRIERDRCPFTKPPKIKGAHWVAPELAVEVSYSGWTGDRKLRHPAMVRLRPDKTPAECALGEGDAPPEDLAKGPKEKRVKIDGREVKLTNLRKIFWPSENLTKGDLISYYVSVSKWLIPHLRDRPMVLKRFPNGIDGSHFWQKDAPAELPEWIETISITEGDHDNRYVLANDPATLAYLANLASIDLNPWSSRRRALDNPDWLILDLDPFEAPFSAVVEVALACREVLEGLGLRGWPKTSGATGMHILVPVEPIYTYEQIRQLARIIANLAHERAGDLSTMEPAIKDRSGRVYLDWLQNIRGKTVASVYSVRPEPGATVSTPLRWDEIVTGLDPAEFTIKSVPDRLKQHGDVFADVLKVEQRIEPAAERL